MGLLSGIGKALGGGGGGGLLGGIGKLFGGGEGGGLFGGLLKAVGGILGSPIGKMLGMVFPPLGIASGAMNMLGMFSNLSGQVGGNESY